MNGLTTITFTKKQNEGGYCLGTTYLHFLLHLEVSLHPIYQLLIDLDAPDGLP